MSLIESDMARWRLFFRPTNRSWDKDFRLVHAVHEYFMNDRFGLKAVICVFRSDVRFQLGNRRSRQLARGSRLEQLTWA